MTDLTFRAPAEKAQTTEGKSEEKPLPKDIKIALEEGKKNLSPELWSETEGKPYLVKLLDLVNVYDDLGAEVRADIELIEDYIKQKVKKGGEDDYKYLLRFLEHITNTRNQPILQKLNEIAKFIKILGRVKNYAVKTR